LARPCGNPDCGDPVPPGRLLFCSDNCGNRVRLNRYSARKRGIHGPKALASLDVPTIRDVLEEGAQAKAPDDFDGMLERVFERIEALPPPAPLVLVPPMPDESLGFGPQDQVALFSDYHRGMVVDPRETGGIGGYNTDIARDRLCRWRDKVIRFRQTYRFETDTLWVPDLGDDLGGHGKIYPAQAYFLDEHLLEQVTGFVYDMDAVFRAYAAVYRKVRSIKIRGNHGRLSDKKGERPERDNIETVAWLWLKDRLKDVENLQIEIAEGFFALTEILGHTFYFAHGEDVLPSSPYAQRGGLNTKLRMNSILGRVINYMCLGHCHYNIEIEREIGGRLITNGSFPGASLLSVKWLHEANLPMQKLFAVHPKYGITHETQTYLATPEEVRDVPVYGGAA